MVASEDGSNDKEMAVREHDGRLRPLGGIAGTQDPKKWAEYEPRSAVEDMKRAYASRWRNSVYALSPWSFIQEKVAQDLQDMEAEAKKGGMLKGVVVGECQHDYGIDNAYSPHRGDGRS